MKMKIKKFRKGAILPKYQTRGAAGFDFHACIEVPVVLKPGESQIFPTGVGFEIPEGYEIQTRSRSGLSFHNQITALNGVGTIDSDFRGEPYIILINHGAKNFTVEPGMRIAQGILNKVERAEWIEVETLAETERGAGGYGSTGLK